MTYCHRCGTDLTGGCSLHWCGLVGGRTDHGYFEREGDEMLKHTPGPWAIIHGGLSPSDQGFSIGSNNAAANEKVICERWPCGHTPAERLEMLANAKLIVAAPDLLAACQSFMGLFLESDMRPEDECREIASIMRAAIAKAESR